MNDFTKSLLNIGITAGLSDRDTFVKGVSAVLEEYQQDPSTAEKISKALADYLEQVKNNINTQDVIKSAIAETGCAEKRDLTELTLAIKELTRELQRHKGGK